MTWAPGGTRNRQSYPRCIECGEVRNPHKAKGLCTTCYLRVKVRAKTRWPESVDKCRRCAVAKTEASYSGRGLCTACYKHAGKHGELSRWRDLRGGETTTAALVHMIGVKAVAELCGVQASTVRRWYHGHRVPEHLETVMENELRRGRG